MKQVKLFFLKPVAVLKDRSALKQFIQKTAKRNGRPIESLNVVFCSDDYLLEINKQYLNHDFYTDIITFDLSDAPLGAINAELYISIDRVRDNAQKMKIPLFKELHRVIFHGILHLLGQKDKSKKDQELMRMKEEELLAKYFC